MARTTASIASVNATLPALLPATPVPISAEVSNSFGWSWWVGLVLYILVAVALWKVFQKAGLPGILGIIPIVNVVFLVKIAGMSMWLALLYLIPLVNIVFAIIVALRMGRGFGHGAVFSIFLLWLLPFVGYLVIGFGDDRYSTPA